MNTINTSSVNTNDFAINDQDWLQYASAQNQQELSVHYATICQQFKQEKKWLLFINPEESSLEQLAQTHNVDISNILCVSFKGKNKTNNLVNEHSAHLDIKQIEKVLCQGNCSAVVLSNASFSEEELTVLDDSARLGETQCVILKSQKIVH